MTASQTTQINWKMAALLFVAALFIRLAYLLVLQVDHPIRGDAFKYFTLAVNLLNHGVYSLNTAPPFTPSTFITPGYPFFLSLIMSVNPSFDGFYQLLLVIQSVLGSISCVLVFLIGCRFLPRRWAFVAGSLCALSPHMTVFGGYVLSETLYVFIMLLSLSFTFLAQDRGNLAAFFIAGVLFSCTALVRPGVMLFPIAVVLLVFLGHASNVSISRATRHSAFFALGFIVLWGGWLSWVSQNQVSGRVSPVAAQVALGSYPDLIFESPELQGFPYKEDPAYAEMSKSLSMSYSVIVERFVKHPATYLSWYLIGKPIMFHQPNILVGQGGAFVYPVKKSLYGMSAPAGWAYIVMMYVHPLLVLLALGFALVQLVSIFREDSARGLFPLSVLSVLLFYFTFLHMALAPLPRYSVPLYPMIYLLAVAAIYRAKLWLGERI